MTTPTYPGYTTLTDTDVVAAGDGYTFLDNPHDLFATPEAMCEAGRDQSWVRVGQAVGWARAKSGGSVWVFRKDA